VPNDVAIVSRRFSAPILEVVDEPAPELPAPPGTSDNAATVEGRRPAPPGDGFGQLWRKELSLTIQNGPPPVELISIWKCELESLWPNQGEIHRRTDDLHRGEVVGIDIEAGPLRLSTGAVVIDATETSFTFLTPQGHMLAGWTRCEAEAGPDGTLARVVIEMRAADPLYEAGLIFGGHRAEERFWAELLWNLASRFGQRPRVRLIRRRLTARRNWRKWTNVRNNAGIHTTLRRLRRAFARAE
jgi:hypothetical protein